MLERHGGPLEVTVSAVVGGDVTAQRQDLESCQYQAAGEDDVLMPEAS